MSSSSIKVAVRCRPLAGQERPAGGLDFQSRRILLDSKTYDPDHTFAPTATQDDVYNACRPILQCVKEGMNGTIMVYGQTGTGKTYTMLGNDGAERGLVHRVVAEMLDYVQQKTVDGAQCALTLSMIEIYNERLTDMLSPNGEEEVTLISGFPRFTHKATLCRVDDAIRTIQRGLAWRHTAATLMNERSSRSHVVFIFDLEEYNAFTEQTDVAHLFMIDLAGSESLKKSQASGVAAGEAGKINKSLLALKSVFLALSNTNEATRPSHVPYRDSKLTELLQDSIGGTARTLMIACISAVGRDIEETKSTLLYAVKARSIRNAANTEREKLLVRLRSMEVENQKLRNRLQERVNERGGYFVTKEEHEQTTEMEESYAQMKAAVEQLMQDRQNSDARQHIWESQVKVLHACLEDKTGELERFKEIYYEALRRFEHQATSLQRLVSGGVAHAKDVVQLSFADHYARLHAWRTELLNALEEPPMSINLASAAAAAPDERAEEDVVAERPQQQDLSEARGTQHHSAATPPVSPMRRDGSTNPVTDAHVAAALQATSSPTATAMPSASGGGGSAGVSRYLTLSRSARGSTASTQRISAASNSAASPSISPTRRIAGGGNGNRSRPNSATQSHNNSSSVSAAAAAAAPRRGASTSPSLGASQHHSSLLPLAPTQTSQSSILLPSATAAATRMPSVKVEKEGETEGQSEQTQSAVVVVAGEALDVAEATAPTSPPRPQQQHHAAPPAQTSWASVLAQHDTQCLRTVQRLNEAVRAVLDACLGAFDQYTAQAESVEETRRRGLEQICTRLRGDVDAHLTQLQRVSTTAERDHRDARDALGDCLRNRAAHHPTAEANTFTQAVRSACGEVVRRAAHVFPHPSTPAAAEAAMDAVAHRVRRCSAAFAVQALDPLSSSSVALAPGFITSAAAAGRSTAPSSSTSSSTAGSPVWSKPQAGSTQLDLALMPRLSPPAAPLSETHSIAAAGRRAGGSALAPADSEDEERGTTAKEEGTEAEEEESVASSSTVTSTARGTRYTNSTAMRLSPPPSSQGLIAQHQQQRASARASSLRGSAPLSSVPVNRGGESRRGNGGGGGVNRCKRTRSNASSSSQQQRGGEAASRRTTSMHRGLR